MSTESGQREEARWWWMHVQDRWSFYGGMAFLIGIAAMAGAVGGYVLYTGHQRDLGKQAAAEALAAEKEAQRWALREDVSSLKKALAQRDKEIAVLKAELARLKEARANAQIPQPYPRGLTLVSDTDRLIEALESYIPRPADLPEKK